MSEVSIPVAPTIALKERLPKYAAHLARLDLERVQRTAKNEKGISSRIRQELGRIGALSLLDTKVDSELTIVCYESLGSRGSSLRTERLAWDLGNDESNNPDDEYQQHLYLARTNNHFYKGDAGKSDPFLPVVTSGLLRRLQTLRLQLERSH